MTHSKETSTLGCTHHAATNGDMSTQLKKEASCLPNAQSHSYANVNYPILARESPWKGDDPQTGLGDDRNRSRGAAERHPGNDGKGVSGLGRTSALMSLANPNVACAFREVRLAISQWQAALGILRAECV